MKLSIIKNISIKIIKSLIVLSAIFMIYGCSQNEETDPIVAKVESKCITVSEFQRSYENSPGHLKMGDNTVERKRHFLNILVKELLLANAGYEMGLDDSETVKHQERILNQELQIEALLDVDVKSKISVTKEEIEAEINKSKVTFKFRYWPVNNLNDAKEIADIMRQKGYAETIDEILAGNPEQNRINPKDFETDYMTYDQLPPDVFEVISNLPYGDISEPVKVENSYLILQVLDIRRKGVTTNEYKSEASKFEQIIFYRKYRAAVQNYVANKLSPMDIKTKAKAFNLLSKAVIEWEKHFDPKSNTFFKDVTNARSEHSDLVALRDYFDNTFFEYKNGKVSTEEFLQYFKTRYVNPQFANARDFKSMLDNAVALSIRDYFLAQNAERRNLAAEEQYQNQLENWKDKWVCNAAVDSLTNNTTVTEEDIIEYYTHHNERYILEKSAKPAVDYDDEIVEHDALIHKKLNQLVSKTDDLKNKYSVQVFYEVLDTISVVEFQKNRWATTKFYRSGTNRALHPSPEDFWRFLEKK